MIDQISLQWATELLKAARLDDKALLAKLRFGVTICLVSLMIIVGCFITGMVSGHLLDQLMVLLDLALLRYFSGGFHFRTNGLCIFFTILLANIISWVPALPSLYVVMNMASLLLVIGLAPSGKLKQKLAPTRHIPYKVISICLLIISFVGNDKIMVYTYLFQSMSMIRMKGESEL